MLKLSLLYRIFQSRKCRYLLFSVWISLSIWFFLQSFLDIQGYTTQQPSSFTNLTTKTVLSIKRKSEKMSNKPKDNLPEIIKTRNEEQFIKNYELFGPITNDTILILIQTNTRKIYLQALIESLKKCRYISETLLIFSHGSYDKDMNKIVEDIQFTRVLQIFFPYSLQTHPDSFPGFSPGDCPYPSSKAESASNCSGKARDFKKIQVKHHWWWKVNFVFDHLRIAKYFQGLVLFLEEDHYVFPDFLHVLKLMRDISTTKCPDCNVFGVGKNPGKRGVHNYKGLSNQVSVQQWNNMGFAFTQKFWQGLNQTRCQEMFCEYNDYNWDFTLAYLSHKCLPAEIKPLTVVSPRVFHVGDCGMHFHGSECGKTLTEVQELQQLVTSYLFPPQLTVLHTDIRQQKVDGHNGGWDDPRDIQLCKDISRNHK